MLRPVFAAASCFAVCVSAPVAAELPEPVKAMIDAAIASGNDADITSVVKLAKATNPQDTAQIDAMIAPYKQQQAELAAANAQAKQEVGLFEKWKGEASLGGFRSTGNTREFGVSGGLKLETESAKWRVKFRGNADYRRNNGNTSKEQFGLSVEPNYKFDERLYAFGLAQYERDRFQGFGARYTLSGGLGYTVIDTDNIELNVKAGPAVRITKFTGGGSETSIAALLGLDFDWQIAENLKFSQDAGSRITGGGSSSAQAVISGDNSTFTATTALDAKLIGNLAARLSYTIEHETNPQPGRVNTDTTSRVSLVYGF